MPRQSALQREILQRRPFASRGQEVLVGLLRTTDLVKRRLTEIVGAQELTLQQYNVLRILRGAAPEGLPTLEIAARMIEQAPGITRLLDRLVHKGLVRRVQGSHDRRRVRCVIQQRGLRKLSALDAPMGSAHRACLGGLTSGEQASLLELLDRIRSAPRCLDATNSQGH
jgi:DNA-binding MarR family transcriptional regulator